MPRPLRIEYEGAWYHVMNRGANHQNIFLNNQHRNIFLSFLAEITKKFYLEIHAYCLMDNHYHLLIHTKLANLGKAMRHIDSLYTQRFNQMEKRDGALFRGRYKAILIEENAYILQVSRYIHLNPVTAKLCKHPEQYYWSSYLSFLNKQNIYWLYKNFTLTMLDENYSHSSYENFINEGANEEIKKFYSMKNLPSILGRKDFIDKKMTELNEKYKQSCSSDVNRTLILPEAQIILDTVSQHFNISCYDLKKPTPGRKNEPKMITIFLLRQLAQLTHHKIAECFAELNPRSISKILARCEKLIRDCAHFDRNVKDLIRKINEIKPVGCLHLTPLSIIY